MYMYLLVELRFKTWQVGKQLLTATVVRAVTKIESASYIFYKRTITCEVS